MSTTSSSRITDAFQRAQIKAAIKAKLEHGEIDQNEFQKLMTEYGFDAQEEIANEDDTFYSNTTE